MRYHFKTHKEGDGYWGECIELKGCVSQGKNLKELKENLKEALDLYIDEPEDSSMVFPLPKKRIRGSNTIEVEVDSRLALAFLVRRGRLMRKWTQKMTAEKLGVPLYSYQKLENPKTANPEWKTLLKLLKIFPDLDLKLAA